MIDYMKNIAEKSQEASKVLGKSDVNKRNSIILKIAEMLLVSQDEIIEANKIDLENGAKRNLSSALLDRLELNEKRISGMVNGLEVIARFEDPLGESIKSWRHDNGMNIAQVSVPIGVIGMIYESRPNVTVDVAGLCIKSGNSVILRGGTEAFHSNTALTKIIREAVESVGMNPDIVQLVENTDRALVQELITLNEYIDVVIPRGGRGLKKAIIANATVPVIETGEGLCHTFIDASAELEMAMDIIINAKTQRTGVCNAMETLLVHEGIADRILPLVNEKLGALKVEMRCCELSIGYIDTGIAAVEEDWSTEYLDLILAIKTVKTIDEAIAHINKYGSGHSEAIVTESYRSTEQFLNEVDASAVYVNASTRFTDGDVFGFGGEIGISTQKLHARGPMGVKALTTKKYIIRGNGQIRG